MRSTIFAVLVLGLLTASAAPAWAMSGGGGGKSNSPAVLSINNQRDAAVLISVQGQSPFTLEPAESKRLSIGMSSSTASLTVTASVVGSPSIRDTKTAQLKAGQTTVAAVYGGGSTLLLVITAPNSIVNNAGRQPGVALASSGGLLPLLWLSCWLGRSPRNRKQRQPRAAIGGASDADPS